MRWWYLDLEILRVNHGGVMGLHDEKEFDQGEGGGS